MPITINGTTGIAGVDGSAGTPVVQGTDTNTGMFFPAADTIAFAEGGTEVMRISSDGNVGIGVSPSATNKLQVSSTGSTRLVVENTTNTVALRIQTATASALIQTDTNHPLTFATNNGAEAMRIDTSGNLIVGDTTTGSRLKVKSTGTTNSTISFQLFDSGGTNEFYIQDGGNINTGLKASSPYNQTTGSAANMFVDSNGNLNRSTSSLKYKTDVNDATHGLIDLLKLRSVTYKGKRDGDTIFGGLIAEEVDAAGLSEFVQYSADGSPDALAYGNMVSLCIKAIQEQQALITQLQADVAALKGTP